jgi:hypothetical protein
MEKKNVLCQYCAARRHITQGEVETANNSLQYILKSLVLGGGHDVRDWPMYLQPATRIMNDHPRAGLRDFSASELVQGYRLASSAQHPDLCERYSSWYRFARDLVKQKQANNQALATEYNLKHRVFQKEHLKPGQQVFVKNDNPVKSKMEPNFKPDPYTVVTFDELTKEYILSPNVKKTGSRRISRDRNHIKPVMNTTAEPNLTPDQSYQPPQHRLEDITEQPSEEETRIHSTQPDLEEMQDEMPQVDEMPEASHMEPANIQPTHAQDENYLNIPADDPRLFIGESDTHCSHSGIDITDTDETVYECCLCSAVIRECFLTNPIPDDAEWICSKCRQRIPRRDAYFRGTLDKIFLVQMDVNTHIWHFYATMQGSTDALFWMALGSGDLALKTLEEYIRTSEHKYVGYPQQKPPVAADLQRYIVPWYYKEPVPDQDHFNTLLKTVRASKKNRSQKLKLVYQWQQFFGFEATA